MLYLAGLGLCSNDIPSSAVKLLGKTELYLERYTSFIPDDTLSFIKEQTGKAPTELKRADLEDGAKEFVARAKAKDITLLVGGDPLVATTHKIIINEAAKQGVSVSVVHAQSILSAAIGESGLDFYRFGQIITIPRWSEHYKPVSFYEIIEGNAKRKLHSLLLLDYDAETRSSLQPGEAVITLLQAESEYKMGIISSDTKILLLHNVSLADKAIRYATLKEAQSIVFSIGPTLMIMPSALTDIEMETLRNRVTG
jgi:diphthine synthase